jgi:hypothetical protein
MYASGAIVIGQPVKSAGTNEVMIMIIAKNLLKDALRE